MVRLDEISIAQGEIIPVSKVHKIQHREGGVVKEIMLEEGQLVQKGQTVIWLDTSENQAKLEMQKIQQASLHATKRRLDACISDINLDAFEPQQDGKRLVEQQQKIIEHLEGFGNLQNAIFQSQVKQLIASLDELDAKDKRLNEQKTLLENELVLKQNLVEKGYETKSILPALQRQLQSVVSEIDEIPLERHKLFVEIQNSSLTELAEINREMAQGQKLIDQYLEIERKSRIRIPIDGNVHALIINAPGEVISLGETVFEVIPKEKEMDAKIKIKPSDIGHIESGQKAIVKFTAYDFSQYGSIEGEIWQLSPSTFIDQQGTPYYEGIVKLEKTHLGETEHEYPILAGMVVEVDIITGSKTLMEYLLKPIFASSRQALRER